MEEVKQQSIIKAALNENEVIIKAVYKLIEERYTGGRGCQYHDFKDKYENFINVGLIMGLKINILYKLLFLLYLITYNGGGNLLVIPF